MCFFNFPELVGFTSSKADKLLPPAVLLEKLCLRGKYFVLIKQSLNVLLGKNMIKYDECEYCIKMQDCEGTQIVLLS